MTFRSAIFRKLLASAFLLIAVTLLVADLFITRYTTRREVQSVEQRLESEARILEGEVNGADIAGLEDWARHAAQRTNARVTVIDPTGVVLADSHHDPETMENHAGRPEVEAAYRLGVGSSIRHSATINHDLCYLALRLEYLGKPGYVLRLSLPLENVDASIAAVRRRILGVSLGAALVALVIAFFFSRSFTARIDHLRAFAEGLGKEQFTQASLPVEEDELGALGRSLGSTALRLRTLVERLSVASEQREAILTSMVEGVLAVDSNLRITIANASFSRAVGAPIPIPPGAPLVEVVRTPELREILAGVMAGGASVKRRLSLPGAAERVFEVQAAPLTSGRARGAIAILHDITDLERLERVRRDFVANVSHELRTPLTAIRGYAETLLDGALEDQENNRKFLHIIHSHAIRLNNMAADLLALSELETEKASDPAERIPVREAIESALHTVEPEARLRNVCISSANVEDVYVMGHRFRLEQALVNLLHNAVKFNHPGGAVEIDARRTPEDKVRIAIRDNGIGVPSAELPRIFERFYRVDKARSREVGGTGLGLSIVKHAAEKMNGTVTAESQLGKGSTFTLVFPAA